MRRELDSTGCQTRVFGNRDVMGYQCSNKPVVTREGKLYCKIHDPEYIKQKDIARRAKWEKEDIESHKRWALDTARKEATKGLTLAELKRVTPDLIRKVLSHSQYIIGGGI